MQQQGVQQYIRECPISIVPKLGRVKILKGIDLIVKVKINVFDQGFWNRDICRVIYELENERLYIKRLEDGHIGIVSKKQVSYPKWESYNF